MKRCEWAYSAWHRNPLGPDGRLRANSKGQILWPGGDLYCAPAGRMEDRPRGRPAERITRHEADRKVGRARTDEMRLAALQRGETVSEWGNPTRGRVRLLPEED